MISFGILFGFLFFGISAHAYLQVARKTGWAFLIEREGVVYFQECGPQEIPETNFAELTPDELLQKCQSVSKANPYQVSSVDYRSWTSAHYGVATILPESGENSSALPSLLRRDVVGRRSQKPEDEASQKQFDIRLELENLIFNYLGKEDSRTLKATDPVSSTLLYSVVSGLVPTFSNGAISFQLGKPSANGWDGCEPYWPAGKLPTLSKVFDAPEIRARFEAWLPKAFGALHLKPIPSTLVSWNHWIEGKQASNGKQGWIGHTSVFRITINRNGFLSQQTKDPQSLYPLCMRRRHSLDASSFPHGPVTLRAIAERYHGFSEAVLYRFAMSDDFLGDMLVPLINPGTGVSEDAYKVIQEKLDTVTWWAYPRFEDVEAQAQKEAQQRAAEAEIRRQREIADNDASLRTYMANERPGMGYPDGVLAMGTRADESLYLEVPRGYSLVKKRTQNRVHLYMDTSRFSPRVVQEYIDFLNRQGPF